MRTQIEGFPISHVTPVHLHFPIQTAESPVFGAFCRSRIQMQVIGNQETAKGWRAVANSRNGVPRCAKSVTSDFANFGKESCIEPRLQSMSQFDRRSASTGLQRTRSSSMKCSLTCFQSCPIEGTSFQNRSKRFVVIECE